jgi:uncharacterized protein (TIGR00270 family)
MECEMCGKQATAIAKIEGTQLNVCDSCARHGTVVKQLPPPKVVQKHKSIAVAKPEPAVKEELVEQVRPDIAKLLRQHREKLKLNQEQFAAKLQVRASTYHHWESGAATPDITIARKLEPALKLPLVVHIKVSTPTEKKHEEARGLTMGDFIKKRK